MELYATPVGITRLETQVETFVTGAVNEVVSTALAHVDQSLNSKAAGGKIMWVIDKVLALLTDLMTMLPDVIKNLKFARLEVSALSKGLNSVFSTFHAKGPPIFYEVSAAYSTLWTTYFVLLAFFPVGLLFYAFWASGWFGDHDSSSQDGYEPPRTCGERLKVCCDSCMSCLRGCHDNAFCFWSFLLLMQVFCLLLFIVAILLCVLSGVKAFLIAGCSGVYIINDPTTCYNAMYYMNSFLTTFHAGLRVPIPDACSAHTLLTCSVITTEMKNATTYTVIGSILASVVTFQMIVEVAVMHERSRWKKLIHGGSQ
jgi:hypothetical protein